ncbi:MAG: thioredoxin fold domain-containing protein [Gammaproteobacteria bacterium]
MKQGGFKRKLLWPVIFLLPVMYGIVSVSADTEEDLPFVILQSVDNLQKTGSRVRRQCMPILLEFSASYCEFCESLEENFLKPMLRNRDYDERVIIRQVSLDSARNITGFDGKRLTVKQFARRYRVFVTPTVLFVNDKGKELAERMVGINTLDMYGGYLDANIEEARLELEDRYRCHDREVIFPD